jgi:hypothetical protein
MCELGTATPLPLRFRCWCAVFRERPAWWRTLTPSGSRPECENHRASQPQAERATKEASDGR